MADNYLEYQAEEMAARRARKEREHKRKLRRYLEAYRKRLAQNAQDTQKNNQDTPANVFFLLFYPVIYK